MTSAAPNRTQLTGHVLARAPHPSVARWDTLTVAVTGAGSVDGERNLLKEAVGSHVTLVVNRDELPSGDLAGWHLAAQVRVAGPEVVEVLPEASGAGRPRLTPPADDRPAPVL
jgi:hypothetical protein